MKTLQMPVRSLPGTMRATRIKRHFGLLIKGMKYVAAISIALLIGLVAAIAVAVTFALALALIVGATAGFAAALLFLVVNPNGNLLLLLLLSQLWLLYAPRRTATERQPDGGLTIEPRACATSQRCESLAA